MRMDDKCVFTTFFWIGSSQHLFGLRRGTCLRFVPIKKEVVITFYKMNLKDAFVGGKHEEQRKSIVTLQNEVEDRDLQQEAGEPASLSGWLRFWTWSPSNVPCVAEEDRRGCFKCVCVYIYI